MTRITEHNEYNFLYLNNVTCKSRVPELLPRWKAFICIEIDMYIVL